MTDIQDNTIKLSTSGERLKYIRALTQLSRAAIRGKFNISDATLRSWEDDKVTISDNKIKICLEAYRKLGIITTLEWVKYGDGLLPSIEGRNPKFIENYILDYEELGVENRVGKQEYLNILLSKSPSFIFYINEQGKFVSINEKFHEIFNKPAYEIIGSKFSDLFSEKEYENIQPFLEKLKNGSKIDILYEYNKNSENECFVTLNLIPHISHKEVVGFYAFVQNNDLAHTTKDVNNFIPSVMDSNIIFNKELFLEAINLTDMLLSNYNLKYNFDSVNKIASNLYAYSIKNNNLSEIYAKSIIKILINSKFFE